VPLYILHRDSHVPRPIAQAARQSHRLTHGRRHGPARPRHGLTIARSATYEYLCRRESGQVLASLIRFAGDFDAAEDALQEATVIALERWPLDGVPDRPGAWLLRRARREAS